MIHEALAAGRCLLGIFHDAEVRDAVATKTLALRPALAETANAAKAAQLEASCKAPI
ncbi:hypothetical protein D3C72_2551670 [compost metagenome]